ncbi:MAG TPA: threonine synthase [Gemmatimonadaceae bacterium]
MPTLPARWQQCATCGMRLGELDPSTSCPACGGMLDVKFHLPDSGTDLRRQFDARQGRIGSPYRTSGVWRYAELIFDTDPRRVVSFPEGNTPLMVSEQTADWAECTGLLLKHEGMNPTGSFKDRGMTVGVTQARRIGASAVACASTGNTSASLAAYAALAGLPALVLVPSGGIAIGKLTQTLAYGARTLAVRADFDACLVLARQVADQLGVYLLNSVNPYRVEGQKSIVFELLQQLEWQSPDWIALPAGNLGNTAAFGKAIDEALSCGLIDTAPRLLAVQAMGASPFQRSYRTGFAERHSMTAETIASAIRIGNPASWERAARAIRVTNGVVVAVDDEAILDAQAVIGAAGVGCEPASAASVAGVRQAVREGLVRRDDRVVAVLTGHVLKDPGILLWYHQDAEPPPPRRNAPIEIEASVRQVERHLRLARSTP